MAVKNPRICCTGYIDRVLVDFETIRSIMESIEDGSIRRPEFYVTYTRASQKFDVNVAALFPEGKGVNEGWFVWQRVEADLDNIAYCRKFDERESAKNVLRCGSPETIKCAAILTQEEVMTLLKSLTQGNEPVDFEKRPYFSVLSLPAS